MSIPYWLFPNGYTTLILALIKLMKPCRLLYSSVCIRMHPYASIRLIYAFGANIQDTFSPKKSTNQKIDESDFSIVCSGAQKQSESNPLYQF